MSLRHGYFTGSGYTYGAYGEPSPERLALLCLLRGQRPVDPSLPFRLLDLGCGQGLHLCLQAANYPQAEFVGVDVNADHIAHARSLAAAAGLANITFRQADVLELVQDPAVLGEPFDLGRLWKTRGIPGRQGIDRPLGLVKLHLARIGF